MPSGEDDDPERTPSSSLSSCRRRSPRSARGPGSAPRPRPRARPRRYLVRAKSGASSSTRCHRVDDAQERQPTRGEPGHTLLVGGVVDRRPAAAGPARPPWPADRRERLVVERRELPGVRGGPVDAGAPRPAPGPASPAPARSAAACPAGCTGRCVEPSRELDHRVDHRLRVDHHLDVVVGHAEQLVRLDHLQRPC